ncbi:MAG TPA: tetratricopeptide repeat protein, partial [Gemmatimonadaceae bacterium]|nr:tetratricopeptide repeat protein [Gemmatimonadaceae bacterium]
MTDHVSALAEGEEAEKRGDLPAAITAYRRLSASEVAAAAAQGLFRLGRVAWRQGRLDDALELYERARAAAIDLGDDELRAAIENGVGSVFCQRGIFTQARASYAVASELAVSAALRGRIQINMGALALLLGDIEQARESYERAVALLDSIGDEEALTIALHNLALAHAEEQDWEAAETSFERCLAIAEKRADRSVIAGVLLNQAELRCESERYPEALERSEKSLALFGEMEDENGRAAALRVQGEIYRKMHQLEEAEPRLKEAIRIAGRLQLLTLEAEA